MDIAGLVHIKPWELELLTYEQLIDVVGQAKAQRKQHKDREAQQKK